MHRLQSDYPKPNRFRYRDGNGCVVNQGLVYCMPQDCPELLALDAITGDLVWSTNDQDVCDCTYQLGVQGESLIVGGDRLVWLDRTSGRLIGQFPVQGTPGVVNALPQPRGLGRAFLVADRVYWPTSEKMYVFGADASHSVNKSSKPLDTPPLLQVMESISLGNEGGNVYVDGPWVLLATPGRLICFYSK
jgi:outer membrane protein assembly factor BamB